MPDEDIEKVKQEILEYLLTHPLASDDFEGITRFWVTRQRIEVAVSTVEQAVESLVKDGLLREDIRRMPDGTVSGTRYKLKRGTNGNT